MKHYDIFIVGAGAAGIAAAKAAWNAGCRKIAIADRKGAMGGILLQCAHRGFGRELNGPEYTQELLADFPEEITFFGNTTVLSVGRDRTAVLSGLAAGLQRISFGQLILAAGCREISPGALAITGTRPVPDIDITHGPSGVFTAGQMQELMNIHHMVPIGPVAILGSGDIGLIMAAQMAQCGVAIAGLIEQKESCGGMLRNRRRLKEYDIPFLFGTTIQKICGYPKLECVILSNGIELSCRTLLIAAGLVPQQELIQDLNDPDWIHVCGNARQVHPMADGVAADGIRAGQTAFDALL